MRINVNGNEEYYYDADDFGKIIRKYLGIQAEREYEYFLNKAREEYDEDEEYDDDEYDDECSLGTWLSRKRIELGYSQVELAGEVSDKYCVLHGKKLNVNTLSNLISKYERGDRNISYKYRKAFSLALNVPYAELEKKCSLYKKKRY